jgi:hypothetical protein
VVRWVDDSKTMPEIHRRFRHSLQIFEFKSYVTDQHATYSCPCSYESRAVIATRRTFAKERPPAKCREFTRKSRLYGSYGEVFSID